MVIPPILDKKHPPMASVFAPNAGHAPYYEEPAEFGRILKSELAAIANQQTDERTAP
jgi:pimeloyl-ACP methyl ester carboxylesterase